MARWDHKLHLGDVWRNEEMSFEQRRDAVVARIRAAQFYDDLDIELSCIVDDLATAEDVRQFDHDWDRFYDWADMARVWVATF
jgi:hypothetical protein